MTDLQKKWLNKLLNVYDYADLNEWTEILCEMNGELTPAECEEVLDYLPQD